MLAFLKRIFGLMGGSPEVFTGALPDDRPQEEKDQDVRFQDIVATAAPVTWGVLDLAKLPDWPVFNQGNTGSCVAFTKALMTSILYYFRTGIWVRFSAKWIYSKRRNKPGEGMIGVDSFDIEGAHGVVPEEMVPSEGLTEQQISAYEAQPWESEVGKALRMSDQRVILPAGDMELVASVQQVTGKPVMVWFAWHYDEYTRSVPVILRSEPPNRHSVTFVPPRKEGQVSLGFFEGEKAIVIQDSWGITSGTINGKRIIKESFYRARNFFAAYSMRFKFDEGQGWKPIYDGTIISVQKILQYEGCFPINVDFVENVGPVTKRSLAQYQLKHGLPITSQLDAATVRKIKGAYSK